jgi:hypothetical protein
VLTNALFWLNECARLRRTSAALALGIGRTWGQTREKLAFNFFDHEGNRRGGSSPDPPKGMQDDNALVVFFRGDDPDDNISQHALKFHRLEVALAPAMNLEANTSAGSKS